MSELKPFFCLLSNPLEVPFLYLCNQILLSKSNSYLKKRNNNNINIKMKRNFLKISLFLIGVFTCLSCEASTTYSSSSSDGVGESIPTAQQWNKDVVGWNLGNAFECSAPGQMVSRCRLATLMVLSMQRQPGAIPLLPRR